MLQEGYRKQVRKVKEEYGISYAALAKKIGITNGYLSMWLHNERSFSDSTLEKLKEYLAKFEGIEE